MAYVESLLRLISVNKELASRKFLHQRIKYHLLIINSSSILSLDSRSAPRVQRNSLLLFVQKMLKIQVVHFHIN